MTRLLLGIVAAVLLSSCSSTDGSPSGDSADQLDAAAFKQEMDAEAQSLLPDLVAALGGQLGGMQATFYERGGFGIYDYTASGVLSGPRGTVAAKLDAATEVLEQHDYAIERDDAKERVTATKGDVGVTVQTGMPTADPQARSLNLRMSSVGGIQDGDDFAESAPPEDYLAYLE